MKLNFSTWLNNLAEIYGGRPAITCGTTMNFDELLDSSRRCAMILNAVGVKKGDKVALWTANGLDWQYPDKFDINNFLKQQGA